jgi:hypothetical protein
LVHAENVTLGAAAYIIRCRQESGKRLGSGHGASVLQDRPMVAGKGYSATSSVSPYSSGEEVR